MRRNSRADFRTALRAAGLTEYEALAYLALLAKRELTAEEISRLSGVPITRVYGTVDQLMQKGFARLVPGRPKRYQSTPPLHAAKDYLAFLRRSFETTVAGVEENLQRLEKQLEPLYWESHLHVKPQELIEPLGDLREMENRTKRSINDAQREVSVSTALFTWLPKVRRELEEALDRGVSVRVLMQVEDEQTRKRTRDLVKMGVKVRDTRDPWHPVRGTLIDNRALCFVIWASEEPDRYWNPKVYRPHHTENPGLIRLFRESFEHRWTASKAVSL